MILLKIFSGLLSSESSFICAFHSVPDFLDVFCQKLLDLMFSSVIVHIDFFFCISYAWGSPSISSAPMLILVSVVPVISLDFPSLGFLLFVFSIFLLFRFSGLEQFYLFPLPSKCIFLYFVRRFVCFLFKDLYVFGCIFL